MSDTEEEGRKDRKHRLAGCPMCSALLHRRGLSARVGNASQDLPVQERKGKRVTC